MGPVSLAPFVFPPMVAFRVTPAIAATRNCTSMQYHVELARHALVEAEVYDEESDGDMMKTRAGIAGREIRVVG